MAVTSPVFCVVPVVMLGKKPFSPPLHRITRPGSDIASPE